MNETDIGNAALQHSPAEATNNGEFPEGTANTEKAHDQALAEEGARNDYIERIDERNEDAGWDDELETPDPYTASILGNRAADAAGERYEIRALAERLGKTEEEVEERMGKDIDAHLEYGLSIIDNKRKFGEAISQGEETFEALAEFAKQRPEIKKGAIQWTDESGDRRVLFLYPIPIEADVSGRGKVIVGSFLKLGYRVTPKDRGLSEGLYREWTVGPYKGEASYKEEETKYEGPRMMAGSTRVETTRSRDQSKEDFEFLKEQLKQVPEEIEQPTTYAR